MQSNTGVLSWFSIFEVTHECEQDGQQFSNVDVVFAIWKKIRELLLAPLEQQLA